MTTLDDIAALLRQQNELLQRFMLMSTMPVLPTESVKSDKARRDAEARQRLEKRRQSK